MVVVVAREAMCREGGVEGGVEGVEGLSEGLSEGERIGVVGGWAAGALPRVSAERATPKTMLRSFNPRTSNEQREMCEI